MILTQLHTQIHELPRQEKYRLIQFIVRELAREDPQTDEGFPRPTRQHVQQDNTSKAQAIDIFIKKWRGFLKDVDPDTAKYQYLQEKYR